MCDMTDNLLDNQVDNLMVIQTMKTAEPEHRSKLRFRWGFPVYYKMSARIRLPHPTKHFEPCTSYVAR